MPNKNKCTKCGQKHLPPTGKKCRRVKNDISDVESEMNLKELSKLHKHSQKDASNSSGAADTSVDTSSEEEEENAVQLQILAELKRVNARLDAVEDKVENNSNGGARPKERQSKKEQSKLSSKYSGTHCEKVSSKKKNVVVKSDSESDSDSSIPDLHVLRNSEIIQRKVDARLRELEVINETSGMHLSTKLKSKRGGPVDVYVKHKVAWPHEAILGGTNRSRVTYDQLTLSQWVQGFCKNILDEKDEGKRERMVAYMADLMEDCTDFTWSGAKAAHAVLCCEFERGTVTWHDTAKIDRIRRAHAQKHVRQFERSWSKSNEAGRKPWFCKPFQMNACSHSKDHEVNGKVHRHICAHCLQQGKVLPHSEQNCLVIKKQHSKNE